MNGQEEIIRKLEAEKKRMELLIKGAEERLAKAPEGSLRVSKCRNHPQYYLKKNGNKNGIYLPASEKGMIRALVQKRYDRKMLRSAKAQLETLERFLGRYDPESIDKLYYQIGPESRELLSFAELPNEIFAEKWQAVKYDAKPFAPGMPEHYTQRGERVRSKSEVMIANALYRAGVPYRYEYPLNLHGVLLHPDFTALRVRDRSIFYMEHLGMLDDTAYRNDAFERIRIYEKNGIFIGGRLIITMETYRQPLNLSSVNMLIRRYLV